MGLWEDVRFAARLLLKDKWFTGVAAVALALGIGVNATVFTFVNAVLIRGLPIADPDRTMAIGSFDRVRNRPMGVSYLDYRDWKESTKAFDAFGAYGGALANLSDEGQPPDPADLSASSDHAPRPIPCGRVAGLGDRRGLPSHSSVTRSGSVDTAATRRSSARRFASTTCRRRSSAWCRKASSFHSTRTCGCRSTDDRPARTEAQLAPAAGVRPPGARRHARAGAKRDDQHLEAPRVGASRYQQGHPGSVQTFNEQQKRSITMFLSLMGVAFVLLIASQIANLLLSRATNRARGFPCASRSARRAGA